MIDETGLAKAPDLAKILDLYNSQTGTINTLWNIFIAVNLGIMGLLFKDAHMGDNSFIKAGFTLGFFFFAYGNHEAIIRAQKILFAISEFLHGLELKDSQVRSILLAHDAVAPSRMSAWHWAFTIMVALVIWYQEIGHLLSQFRH
jgi:uncharacterized YccA/Bax inhibitor family protein